MWMKVAPSRPDRGLTIPLPAEGIDRTQTIHGTDNLPLGILGIRFRTETCRCQEGPVVPSEKVRLDP